MFIVLIFVQISREMDVVKYYDKTIFDNTRIVRMKFVAKKT